MKVALMTLLLLVGGCRKMDRPGGLPQSAVLMGTPEKYYFIDCARVGAGTDYSCTVYGASGNRMASGVFGLQGGPSFNSRDRAEYSGFDGSEIALTENRHLVVHEPPRPEGVPASAVWGGGPTCGGFLDCTSAAAGRIFDCKMFADDTGTIIAQGRYELHGDIAGGLRAPKGCDAAAGGHIFLAGTGAYLARVK
jgi:hypothetical protein